MVGSYPLQGLLGEYYPGSDIDIFIKENTANNENNCPHEFLTWLCKKYSVIFSESSNPMHGVVRSIKITKSKLVNIVIVATDNLQQYVNNNFDLSFCQTTFDGNTFRYDDLSLKKIGYKTNQNIVYHSHLIDKTIKNSNNGININPDIKQTLDNRVNKYKNRGFIIIENPLIIDDMTKKDLLDMIVDQFHQNSKLNEEIKQSKNKIQKGSHKWVGAC